MTNLDIIWQQLHDIQNKDDIEPERSVYEIKSCTTCGSRNSICEDSTHGTIVCTRCGFVLESDIMDETAEWTSCGADSNRKAVDPTRCGVPINPLLRKSSMSTVIQSTNTRYRFMQKLHNQSSMNYVERNRYHVYEHISKMASENGHLSNNVVEQAKYYYKELSKRKLSRGVIRKGLIACCILYACKNMNVSRSIKEISLMTNVPVPTINKTTKIFMDNMHDILLQTQWNAPQSDIRACDYVFEATDSNDLITRFCNLLHIDDKKTHIKLVKLSKTINNDMNVGHVMDCKTPSAITGGVIMYACQQLSMKQITKNMLSKLFCVSIVTINKIVKMIVEHYKINDSSR